MVIIFIISWTRRYLSFHFLSCYWYWRFSIRKLGFPLIGRSLLSFSQSRWIHPLPRQSGLLTRPQYPRLIRSMSLFVLRLVLLLSPQGLDSVWCLRGNKLQFGFWGLVLNLRKLMLILGLLKKQQSRSLLGVWPFLKQQLYYWHLLHYRRWLSDFHQ